jgi:hypothetical protein
VSGQDPTRARLRATAERLERALEALNEGPTTAETVVTQRDLERALARIHAQLEGRGRMATPRRAGVTVGIGGCTAIGASASSVAFARGWQRPTAWSAGWRGSLPSPF